jgi:hypothetical protein
MAGSDVASIREECAANEALSCIDDEVTLGYTVPAWFDEESLENSFEALEEEWLASPSWLQLLSVASASSLDKADPQGKQESHASSGEVSTEAGEYTLALLPNEQTASPVPSVQYSEDELGGIFDAISNCLSGLPDRTAVEKEGGDISWPADALQQNPLTGTDDELVEKIRFATEAVLWGDKRDTALLDLFFERQMLACFVNALSTRESPSSVSVQILQSLLMLVQNMGRSTTFFYMLSGDLMNVLFNNPPNLKDEEVLTYFVALLKGLALRLDSESAKLMVVTGQRAAKLRPVGEIPQMGIPQQRLPIFERAALLAGHSEPMVRTAARASILALLGLHGATIRDAVEDSFDRLCAPVLSRMLQAAWMESVKGLKGFRELCTGPKTRGFANEACDELRSYVRDLLTLDQPAITRALALHLDEEVMTWAMPERKE